MRKKKSVDLSNLELYIKAVSSDADSPRWIRIRGDLVGFFAFVRSIKQAYESLPIISLELDMDGYVDFNASVDYELTEEQLPRAALDLFISTNRTQFLWDSRFLLHESIDCDARKNINVDNVTHSYFQYECDDEDDEADPEFGVGFDMTLNGVEYQTFGVSDHVLDADLAAIAKGFNDQYDDESEHGINYDNEIVAGRAIEVTGWFGEHIKEFPDTYVLRDVETGLESDHIVCADFPSEKVITEWLRSMKLI